MSGCRLCLDVLGLNLKLQLGLTLLNQRVWFYRLKKLSAGKYWLIIKCYDSPGSRHCPAIEGYHPTECIFKPTMAFLNVFTFVLTQGVTKTQIKLTAMWTRFNLNSLIYVLQWEPALVRMCFGKLLMVFYCCYNWMVAIRLFHWFESVVLYNCGLYLH